MCIRDRLCTRFYLQSDFVYDNIISENQKKKGMKFLMKKLNFKTRKNQKGITLIALVITIIVLLILAGVSIATLTGENGILTRANEAKTSTEQAEEDELRRLTALEAATNLENQLYKDKNEDTATIPACLLYTSTKNFICNNHVSYKYIKLKYITQPYKYIF